MAYNRTPDEVLDLLRKEQINTWFELGLFIDRIRENRKNPPRQFDNDFQNFEYNISKGIAFITFHFSIDGVTIEIGKYASIFKLKYPEAKVHYISGVFKSDSDQLIPPYVSKYEIPQIQGFNDWKFYRDFYFTHLERGSEDYNRLIREFWDEILLITEKLSRYIYEQEIELVYLVNVCSNPGNVSLSMAMILVSELMGIPVINNNHDFYWEGGSRRGLLSTKQKDKGPRDFFFTNAHIGEFFTIIEMVFPWESRFWINVNINRSQTNHLINVNGINPANVMEIGTAVDTSVYRNIDKRKKINAFIQFEKILSRYRDKLVAYSVEDVLDSRLVDEKNPKPILIGNRTRAINKFTSENIIFLQPTRIISRKRIEVGFRLLLKLIEQKEFRDRLQKTKKLKITILITGPIAPGHYDYFERLLNRFRKLLQAIPETFRKRIYLAMLFSELDQESFKQKFEEPVGIPELYNIASLILLPSKTEGRGLPIIESTACGTPIFCRRYYPENVYSEVIGEHLEEQDRLLVIEYDGRNIKRKTAGRIIERVMFPHKFSEEIRHNRQAVLKRYSLQALKLNIQEIIYRLYLQLQDNTNAAGLAKEAFTTFKNTTDLENPNFKSIMKTENRQYLPGYGKLAFMIYLKSLIDPSYFRIEEQEFRGRAFNFALDIVNNDHDKDLIPDEKIVLFFNAVENLFLYREGEIHIRHDHSFTYRHRNKNYYPYQDYTIQEICGLINILYFNIIDPTIIKNVNETPHFFTDWNLALLQLTGSNFLGIDNRKELISKLKENIPIAYFPGDYIMYELEFFALQAIRSRLKLPLEIVLDRKILNENTGKLEKVYVFTQEKNLGQQLNLEETKEYIINGLNEELKLLYEYGILEIIPTQQWTVGIHFGQLGSEALKILKEIKERRGFLISNRRNSVAMTDFIDIDCFHVGKVRARLAAEMLGIPMDSGYIQFVPAGIRTCLAYPTPIQTAKDFEKAMKSKKFKLLTEKIGKENLFKELKKDAEEKSSPVNYVLDKLITREKTTKEKSVDYEYISGIYEDHNPYNGVLARIQMKTKEGKWDFSVESSKDKPMKVTEFVRLFEEKMGIRSKIAWNGGYILNPELVGKLGLPESYIGSPLGLIISGGKILSPPLFNKAALFINNDGSISMDRVNCREGFIVNISGKSFESGKENYNPAIYDKEFCYYDLLYPEDKIYGNERVIVRLAGNVVKDILYTKKDEMVDIIPVGITLSFRKDIFPKELGIEDRVEIIINNLVNVKHAIEAGPILLNDGEICIDMEKEGWKTANSIKTQAARLDYLDMRGPKIAAGIDDSGNLAILAINGRIRESVGASHRNMAEILKKYGMKHAMGFDPGGSSTLVVNGRERNISPYNSNYEENIYSMKPEPRAVSNAIIGFIREG